MSPRRRRKRTAVPAAPAGARTSSGVREKVLRFALFGVLGLLLLTPFVVTPGTVYPFVVGKALWSRSLIEVAFALWAMLALMHPGYRPPRSWLLVLLVAGYCATLLSAGFGVNPGHSLWSDYERMQGLVDRAHWVALAVVLASVLHTPPGWRALLQANLAAGAAMAGIVIARALDIGVPYFGALPEISPTRLGGPFGNPGYLSIYMLVNLVLAAGFAARAWATVAPPGDPGERRAGVLLWTTVAALHLAGVVLSGSVGGYAGLVASTGFAALGFAWHCRGRGRLAAVSLLVVLATVCTVLGTRFVDPGRASTVVLEPSAVAWPGGGALRYVGGVHLQRPSVQSRLAAWEAGLAGFTERPLLGWGPGNFDTVFGLFGSGYAATAEPHDRAHSVLIERAVTTGMAGLATWLALWGGALAVLVLAASRAPPPERALTIFVAAALAGHLTQLLFLFDTAAGTLVSTLLLAYAARLEPGTLLPARRQRFPAPLMRAFGPRARAVFRRPGVRAAAGAAAVVLGGRGAGGQPDHSHGRRHALHGPGVPADRRGGRRHRSVPSAGRRLPEIPVHGACQQLAVAARTKPGTGRPPAPPGRSRGGCGRGEGSVGLADRASARTALPGRGRYQAGLRGHGAQPPGAGARARPRPGRVPRPRSSRPGTWRRVPCREGVSNCAGVHRPGRAITRLRRRRSPAPGAPSTTPTTRRRAR